MTGFQMTIPETPTPKLVYVKNISPEATEEKVREFFLFCGKISEFEVITSSNGDKEALVMFEKDSAAKTATMLSNAVIAEKQINVEYYFKDEYSGEHRSTEPESSDGNVSQEEKPKTSIVTELLAAGFSLSVTIINRAKTFDEKYGVMNKAQTAYQQALTELTKLDEKYKVRDMVVTRATALNESYKITDKIYYAANQMQTAATRALETGPGQQASKLLSQATTRAIDTVNESRKLAEKQTE
ncbi:hypothetical protein BDF19DRAFT_448021 [Syncephalis fuscata]|nr:hypothetical protein BDF19DRAFT_448021 [Syncephalis fuscata]